MAARFVQIGITGFKSFADPISLDILPGLTGIVGPNGCGKSNVVEALRWAMGEGNPRHLRGGEMDDVIFAGSANRPSRNLAEVSLAIEANGDELLQPFAAGSDLWVTRRIERGRGSAYRINGREARTRDVQTLFADMASGARSSAMVSQGRVAAVVNARPEDRRAVLEEAAGITGLHVRRTEAETRLRAAEANLDRAEERRALLEKQIAGLHDQAKQAGRYRAIVEAALDTEALLLAIGRAQAERSRTETWNALETSRTAVEQSMAAAERLRTAAAEVQAGLPALRDAEGQLRTRVERARIAEENIAAETERATAALQAATQRRDQAAQDLEHVQSAMVEGQSSEARSTEELSRIRAEEASHLTTMEAACDAAKTTAQTMQAADTVLVNARTRAAEMTAKAEAIRHIAGQAATRLQRATEALARLGSERERMLADAVDPSRLHAAAQALTLAEDALANAQVACEGVEAAHEAARIMAGPARDAYITCDAIRHRLGAEKSAIEDILAVSEGESWTPMVDLLDVPAGLEAALGAVLGDELGASDDPRAARHWRVLPSVEFPLPSGRPMAADVSGPAILARALAGIVVVEDEAQGDACQARLMPGQCLVSRGGAIWRWDGYTVRAGTPTQSAVRLQQRNRLTDLRARHIAATTDLETARADRESADMREQNAYAALRAARSDLRTVEALAERARTDAAGLRSRADQVTTQLEALSQQLLYAVAEHEAAMAAAEVIKREQADLPDTEALHRLVENRRTAFASARSREAEAARHLHGLERAASSRQARHEHLTRERDELRQRVAALSDRANELTERLADADAELAHLTDAPAKAAGRSADAHLAVAKRLAEHEAALHALADADRQAAEAAVAARGAEHAVFARRENYVRAESAAAAAERAWAAIRDRIAEREDALPVLPVSVPDTAEAEERARKRLARLVKERDDMGPVNLRADIEAAAIAADIRLIENERDELANAIAKLRGGIGHLNREGRERLAAVFQQVDRQFQTLFTRMFGGGRAHLALVGSDDPLHAGLEIYAQPPGKKLVSLSLLSGGEQALAALCLVFAIFHCNPAPLCVLDEVDAPLDDANVERFCGLLAEIVEQTGTRFLVVTHHRLTMARMDRLFGITMQERGVSRLLSVDLRGAAQFVESAAAE